MKNLMSIVVCVTLFLAGLCLGSSAAEKKRTLSFSKASLYKAMTRLHREAPANLVFVNAEGTTSVRPSFTVDGEDAESSVKQAASAYNLTAVPVSRVYVLERPIPPASTPMGRLEAVRAWIGDPEPLMAHRLGTQARAPELAKGLGEREDTFRSLTPDQRQSLLNLVRAGWSGPAAGGLYDLLKISGQKPQPTD